MFVLLFLSCAQDVKIMNIEDGDAHQNDSELDETCDELIKSSEASFLPQGSIIEEQRNWCDRNWHASAGAKGSTLSITLESWQGEEAASIQITNILDEAIVDWTVIETGEAITFDIERSGEFFIHIAPDNIDEPENTYSITSTCISGCELEYTRYPMVFLHGLAGFDSFLNVVNYWVGVESLLTEQGFHVEVHNVSAFDTTEVRTQMWMSIIEELLDSGVARKFNLIGHSQGGLDARYIASVHDQIGFVESITTVGTPHHGTAVADLLNGTIELSPFNGTVIDAFFDMATQIFGTTGENFSAQMEQMSMDTMNAFNQDILNVEEVTYYSWAGKSCRYIQFGCQSEMDGETVSSYFLLSHTYLEGIEGDNDGLVSVQSAQWGEYLGEIPADHMDEVGHRLDLSSQPFDAASFYLEEARRLSVQGH
jgi:triacylglycerol esterase/lipase EstA (alpha/beta hydrolase family)